MAADRDRDESTLSPDAAFSALGNETRIEILRILGEADDHLAFSELRERVGMRDSGQFNYHLDRLIGHFVQRTDDGYALHHSGRRVVEAVLSGAITDTPVVDRTRIDKPCFHCGAPIEVGYEDGRVVMYCRECRGGDAGAGDSDGSGPPGEEDRIGHLYLPPAGVQERTPAEILQATYTWYYNQVVTMASGVCPRCSAGLDHPVRVCEDHDRDTADGVCDRCGNRSAARIRYRCTNCIFERDLGFSNHFVDHPDLHAFMIDHGVDVVSPSFERLFATVGDDSTRVVSTTPFEAEVVFSIDDDSLVLSVDESLTVTDATRT